MNRTRQFLALLAGGIGTAAALLGAPNAAAEEYGGGGPDNPLLPGCAVVGAGEGGQTEDCASPGSSSITASPSDLGIMGAMVDGGFGGFGGW
jgi:hypothetical protein